MSSAAVTFGPHDRASSSSARRAAPPRDRSAGVVQARAAACRSASSPTQFRPTSIAAGAARSADAAFRRSSTPRSSVTVEAAAIADRSWPRSGSSARRDVLLGARRQRLGAPRRSRRLRGCDVESPRDGVRRCGAHSRGARRLGAARIAARCRRPVGSEGDADAARVGADWMTVTEAFSTFLQRSFSRLADARSVLL